MPVTPSTERANRPSRRGRHARRETGRSRTGCLECRSRRVKCDESRPSCNQCQKTSRSCSILDSGFKASSYTFHINEAASTFSGPAKVLGGSTGPTRNNDNVTTQGEPQDCNTLTELENQESPISSVSSPQHHVDEGDTRVDGEAIMIFTPASLAEAGNTAAIGQSTFTESGLSSSGIPATVQQSSESVTLAAGRNHTGTQFESPDVASFVDKMGEQMEDSIVDLSDQSLPTASLFRRYSECLAHGIELFSYGHHSITHVLRLAQAVDLLRFVTCAAAAKQLGHIRHASHQNHSSPAGRSRLRDSEFDYLWLGARYYGSAIQSMWLDISLDESTVGGLFQSEMQWASIAVCSPSSQTSQAKAMTTEARLMAACVMCQYEELSASRHAWARHLDGLFRLLHLSQREDTIHDFSDGQSASPTVTRPHALQSFFWYFVHNDFEESFISKRPTRMNSTHSVVWTKMGLIFDGHGHLNPTGALIDCGSDQSNRDKAILHMLLWILCSVVHYSASTERTSPSIVSPTSISSTQNHMAKPNWQTINGDLDLLRESAGPLLDADITQLVGERSSDLLSGPRREAWYLSSTLAMAAVYFHMAKIMLLSAMPSEPFAVMSDSIGAPDWISAYRRLHQEMSTHARDLISIALGSPPLAVKLHMLQPLYVAGRCLTGTDEQDNLLNILGDMERDLGVATGYRARDLLHEWGRPSARQNSDLDKELSDLSSREEW